MKALLVLDLPALKCNFCPIYNMGYYDEEHHEDYRDKWCKEKCLLIPMPKKMKYNKNPLTRDLDEEYLKAGWNACIDELLGENDESDISD